MTVNFYIHSKSGNSLNVAGRIQKKVLEQGFCVKFSRIIPSDENQRDVDKLLISPINSSQTADLIIIGGPVRWFSASTPLLKAIDVMDSLEGKKVIIFLTQFLPYDGMGGRQAIEQLKAVLQKKGATVVEKESIHWKRGDREDQIEKLEKKIQGILREIKKIQNKNRQG